jgi:aminoglycoside phosphotransferase (APT) family kinase protein
VLEGLPTLASVLEAHGLAGVTEEPLEHDGWSGALITRLTRGDGARFVLKRASVERDWIARITDDAGLRETRLVHAAPTLPAPVQLPHLAVAADGVEIATLMPDLTGTLLKWEAPTDADTVDRVLAGLAALHSIPWQAQLPPGFPWTDLRTRICMLTRRSASRYEAAGLPVGARFNAGWDAFDRLVRPPVKDLLDELTARPEPLVAALERLPVAGLHGDLKLGNAGLAADGAMLVIDWQLTLVAPIAVELGWFLVCNVASLPMTPAEVMERYRVAAQLPDDETWLAHWDLAVLVGLLLRGWRKGLDTEAGVVYPNGKAAAWDLAWWGSQALGAAGRRL